MLADHRYISEMYVRRGAGGHVSYGEYTLDTEAVVTSEKRMVRIIASCDAPLHFRSWPNRDSHS